MCVSCQNDSMVGVVSCVLIVGHLAMYTDDLALISESPSEDLQLMLNIVSSYAQTWQYE